MTLARQPPLFTRRVTFVCGITIILVRNRVMTVNKQVNIKFKYLVTV